MQGNAKIANQIFRVAKNNFGFTLVEVIVSLAIFAILAAGILGSYAALVKSVKLSREKTVVASLANDYMELVRNLSYLQVGTLTGNPNGSLADLTNPILKNIESASYKIYYEVTYIDDPADGVFPTDLAANDSKQVKMNVLNVLTNQVNSFVTTVSPKGLEGSSNAGALWVKVFDYQGQPVSGANVHIEYPTTTPTIVLDRQTDSAGNWIEVNLPAAVNLYRIVVTKSGYSSDQTYPVSADNINPIKPDATIANGQITQVSFAIDLVSNLTIKTQNNTCQSIDGINLNVRGAKLIGTPPDVYKFDQNYTSSGGQIVMNNIEWDTYTPTMLTGQSYVVKGTSPIQKIDVLPGSNQTFFMILGANSTANSLLIVVKDGATGAALEGALVHLRKGGSEPQDYNGISGGSVWTQNDLSGGAGQAVWSTSTPDRYFQDDGNVDSNSAPTGLRLKKISGNYQFSGWLESSTFDTGSVITNFTTISWQPTSQDPATVLKFQIAANNDNATWQFLGPDGTNASYYTVSGNNISSALDSKQFVRYKAFLTTTNDKKTPVLTSVSINYVSGCATPGQVFFPDLTSGNNYDLDVSMSGYTTETQNNIDINNHQTFEILLSP